ncbi:MAG: hypothetical protein HKM24_02700 [Gammaproteobacteria bacterium]|nr:hypothetical protein [Gammaproteobacteria bacterium]
MTAAKITKSRNPVDDKSTTLQLPTLHAAEFDVATEDTVAIEPTINAHPGLALVDLDRLNQGFNPYDNHDRWLTQRLQENARKYLRSS